MKIEEESPQEATRQDGQPPTDELTQRWKAAIALLLTIPGIGWLTACWLVVTTLNFTMCETAEAAVHFVGLAPMVRLSGTSVHGRAQISRGGFLCKNHYATATSLREYLLFSLGDHSKHIGGTALSRYSSSWWWIIQSALQSP
jgi:hypothetical protein